VCATNGHRHVRIDPTATAPHICIITAATAAAAAATAAAITAPSIIVISISRGRTVSITHFDIASIHSIVAPARLLTRGALVLVLALIVKQIKRKVRIHVRVESTRLQTILLLLRLGTERRSQMSQQYE
jgi:hypothetical protein